MDAIGYYPVSSMLEQGRHQKTLLMLIICKSCQKNVDLIAYRTKEAERD